MLSEAMKAEGWIEHDGGACPVAEESRLQYKTRNGWSGVCDDGRLAGDFDWRHTNHPGDIIAYKPEGTLNDH